MCSLEVPHYALIIGGIVYAILEAWLGKTDKVRSGSVVELIINLIAAIMRRKK